MKKSMFKCNYEELNGKEVNKFVGKIIAKYKASGKREIVVINVGTPKNVGDMYAPMIGTVLERLCKNIVVYGTTGNPIQALNVNEKVALIKSLHKNAFIIAIGCAIGKTENIGSIMLRNEPLKPGAGVGKILYDVGDVSIVGVLTDSSWNLFNGSIKFNFTYKLATKTIDIIKKLDKLV